MKNAASVKFVLMVSLASLESRAGHSFLGIVHILLDLLKLKDSDTVCKLVVPLVSRVSARTSDKGITSKFEKIIQMLEDG